MDVWCCLPPQWVRGCLGARLVCSAKIPGSSTGGFTAPLNGSTGFHIGGFHKWWLREVLEAVFGANCRAHQNGRASSWAGVGWPLGQGKKLKSAICAKSFHCPILKYFGWLHSFRLWWVFKDRCCSQGSTITATGAYQSYRVFRQMKYQGAWFCSCLGPQSSNLPVAIAPSHLWAWIHMMGQFEQSESHLLIFCNLQDQRNFSWSQIFASRRVGSALKDICQLKKKKKPAAAPCQLLSIKSSSVDQSFK